MEQHVPVHDELGELTATFSTVAVGRRDTEAELRRMHEDLEHRVAQRTRDLARANAALELEIEERRRAEAALRASEQRFRRVFEEGPLGVGLFDGDNRFLQANQSLARMLGTSPEEMVGRPIADFAHADVTTGMAQAWEAFRLGRPSFRMQGQARRADGEGREINAIAAAIRDGEGGVDYGVLMVEDVTERKRAEALLRESERYAATGRMAARIAHEINNPLAGIKNAFRLVKDSIPADHPHVKYVGRIDREIDRVARIVRQMYGIYRPESEGVRQFRVDEAIEDVVALITAGGTPEDSPRIALDLDHARTSIHQVEGTLRQILYNLLRNAIEASPPGTSIDVRARVSGEHLVIIVADRGGGIREGDQQRIFEPFFTTKEGLAGAGLGLGLAISHRGAEAMGGHLEFESEPGVGTTFVLTLPLDTKG